MRLIRARTSRRPMQVDDAGLDFGEAFSGSFDVVMDDHRVWSYATDEHRTVRTIAWPKRLRRLLEGTADVRVTSGDDVLFEGTVVFGNGEGRPSFVDPHGIPIFVDKWGLIQRPFSGRREAGVVDTLVEATRQVLTVMREECGIEGWISFGTLLGAARDGGVIGHDSDIDLCFLSERETPAGDDRGAVGHRTRAASRRDAGAAQVGQLPDRARQGAGRRPRRPRHLHLLLRRATSSTRPRPCERACPARRSCR